MVPVPPEATANTEPSEPPKQLGSAITEAVDVIGAAGWAILIQITSEQLLLSVTVTQ